MSGKATLTEIERNWTLNDLADAHEALDIEAESQMEAERRQSAKIKGG
jgi:hypothetical protein